MEYVRPPRDCLRVKFLIVYYVNNSSILNYYLNEVITAQKLNYEKQSATKTTKIVQLLLL